MTEITDEMLDIIEKVKGKRNPALWDPRCEQYQRKLKEGTVKSQLQVKLSINTLFSLDHGIFSWRRRFC